MNETTASGDLVGVGVGVATDVGVALGVAVTILSGVGREVGTTSITRAGDGAAVDVGVGVEDGARSGVGLGEGVPLPVAEVDGLAVGARASVETGGVSVAGSAGRCSQPTSSSALTADRKSSTRMPANTVDIAAHRWARRKQRWCVLCTTPLSAAGSTRLLRPSAVSGPSQPPCRCCSQ